MSSPNPVPPIPPAKTLSDHFTVFRIAARLDELTQEKALFIQNSYIAGAAAAFQVLHAASSLPTKEEAAQVWKDLWAEIQGASVPPAPVSEKPLIIRPN